MPKHNKSWVKSKVIVTLVGNCRYCSAEILNTDSFVSFYPKVMLITNVCVKLMKIKLLKMKVNLIGN